MNHLNLKSQIISDPDASAVRITSLLSEPMSFSCIKFFPDDRGIYFLYLKDTGELLYIGSAYAEKRSLRKRCIQYLQIGSGSNSFTGKIATLNGTTRTEAIEFVRGNVEARFIVTTGLSEKEIRQHECLSIWSFRPKLNFIQPESTLAELVWP